MKVKDLMSNEFFADFKLIAGGGGINKEIRAVSVMDAPDIYRWMKGGEFLITTGYIMKDKPILLKQLIINLDKWGASAIGIKLNRYIDKLPIEIIECANRLNFPIIYVPLKYSFVDIINPVLTEVVNSQARRLEYSQMIHNSFTKLVIGGGSIKKIISTLSNILDTDIVYYDKCFEKKYYGRKHHHIEELKDKDNVKQDLEGFKNYPILLDGNICGYIFIDQSKQHLEEYSDIAIEHASTILKLEIQKKISNLQIEEKHRDEFIQDLLMNNIKSEEEIIDRAKTYNWTFKDKNQVVIFDIDDYKAQYLQSNKSNKDIMEKIKKQMFLNIKNNIKLSYPNSMYTSFSDSMIMIFSFEDIDTESFNEKLKVSLNKVKESIKTKYNFTLTIALGEIKNNTEDINLSYKEAKKAIVISRNISKKDIIISYSQLGIYKLLYKVYDEEETEEFYKTYLSKLIEYDNLNNTEFLNTLNQIFKSDWNLKQASEEMFVHYNTVKYRFNKIIEILDIDLRNSENKLNIAIALKLLEMYKK